LRSEQSKTVARNGQYRGHFSRGAFRGSKLYDVAAALPLLLLYGWVLLSAWPRLTDLEAHDPQAFAETASALLSYAFGGLLIVLVLTRSLPWKRSPSRHARAVALLGAGFGMAVLLLPRAELPAALALVAALLVLVGMGGAFVTLFWLKRAFSILPEARELVMAGPYRFVRHPLYFFEELAFFGVMLQFVQPWAFAIFLIQLGFQVARMRYEERVLAAIFPQYAAYAAKTPRLLPGVY